MDANGGMEISLRGMHISKIKGTEGEKEWHKKEIGDRFWTYSSKLMASFRLSLTHSFAWSRK